MSKSVFRRTVDEVMVRDIVWISPADRLDQAVDIMMENDCSALPVVDARRRCVGILAAMDLLGPAHQVEDQLQSGAGEDGEPTIAAGVTGLAQRRVEEAMTAHVVAVDREATLPEAAALMLHEQVHHLVVLEPDATLTGILSTMDVLQSLVDSAPEDS